MNMADSTAEALVQLKQQAAKATRERIAGTGSWQNVDDLWLRWARAAIAAQDGEHVAG